uniref:Reverse transcriptase zinc-binding domain-containing protein n=1 Tax=Oryza brachyantha TaxID=4533 RepID=J3L6R6_ORYBR
MISSVALKDCDDSLIWELEGNKGFSSRSLYRFITFRGMSDKRIIRLWAAPIPPKVKHFWLLLRDRIQSAANLKARNWDGSEFCKLCGQLETCQHIIFQCPLAKFMWCLVRDVFDWQLAPNDLEMFFYLVVDRRTDKQSRVVLMLLGACCWSVWLIRNDMVFREKLVSSPCIIIYRVVSFLSQWRVLAKEDEEDQLETMKTKLLDGVKNLRPRSRGRSDA